MHRAGNREHRPGSVNSCAPVQPIIEYPWDDLPYSNELDAVADLDTVLFSAIATRREVLNLARDPRISLAVFDVANPYQSVEIRGVAELAEDTGKWLPKALSHKYLGQDPQPEPDEVTRVIVRVRPQRINVFSA